jgi:hypothetical protein
LSEIRSMVSCSALRDRQHADGEQPSPQPLDPRPARVEHVGEVAFGVLQHAAPQPAGSQVQLHVELAELVLHVLPPQARQHRIVDQPRPAQRVHEVKLHLHADGVLVVDEPAAVDHALQRGNAPLKPALHLVRMPDHQSGRVDAVTHGAPPQALPALESHYSTARQNLTVHRAPSY